jgi:hypothetical protein
MKECPAGEEFVARSPNRTVTGTMDYRQMTGGPEGAAAIIQTTSKRGPARGMVIVIAAAALERAPVRP